MKSAPFPGANAKVNFTPDQAAKARAHFEELDARGRLYITQEEHAAMIRQVGFVSNVSFGPSGVWLNPASHNMREMFDFIMKLRTSASLESKP